MIEVEILRAEALLDKVSSSSYLCLRKCGQCGLCCVNTEKHSGLCDCKTDHLCWFDCELCDEPKQCKLSACHDGTHMCDTNHTCK